MYRSGVGGCLRESEGAEELLAELGISINVETHRTNLFRKLKVRSVVALVRYALRHGVVEM
jgi:DNA-binding CsgD family transcriptional regulator